MTLHEAIYKRKSTRKYNMSALDEGVLSQIKQYAETLKPLYSDIRLEYKLVTVQEIKCMFPIKAPYYFIISSEKKDRYLLNAGFMFQQMDLYLSSLGLGSCWQGMARPAEKIKTDLEFVIVLAFGESLTSPQREPEEFIRKSLSEISDVSDKRLEPVRLAPSATNSQPWYFVTQGDVIHIFRLKLGAVKAIMYEKMNQIDIGIALCHLYIANEKNFNFYKEQNIDEPKGYIYIGSVKL